jgi:hypothetical protein
LNANAEYELRYFSKTKMSRPKREKYSFRFRQGSSQMGQG